MFQVDDAWEQTNERDILRLLFNQPGLRRHPLVEVVDNPAIFHVDVMFEGEAEELGFWARFIGADLETVLQFISGNDVVRSSISIQSPFSRTEDYNIHKVDKIYECRGPDGATYFQYECAENSSVPAHHAKVGEAKRVVWSACN
jgi:hypothetical protein